QVLNMIRNGDDSFSGMTRSDIASMIGSGLAQLNREMAAQAMQQLLFAIIQNPRSAEQYDVIGLMNYWSRLMNLDTDLRHSQIQQPTPAAGAAPAPGAAPMPAAGPAGAPAV